MFHEDIRTGWPVASVGMVPELNTTSSDDREFVTALQAAAARPAGPAAAAADPAVAAGTPPALLMQTTL